LRICHAGLRPRASPHLFCENTRVFALLSCGVAPPRVAPSFLRTHARLCTFLFLYGWETRLYARIKHVNA